MEAVAMVLFVLALPLLAIGAGVDAVQGAAR